MADHHFQLMMLSSDVSPVLQSMQGQMALR
jgi:hypothetical protein